MTGHDPRVGDPRADADSRAAFKADIVEHVKDLGRMCRFVMDRPTFPVPLVDLFTPRLYSVTVWSDGDFERYSALLVAEGPVQWDSGPHHRAVRRQFGSVLLEVWQSHGERVPDDTAAKPEVA